MKLKMYDDKGWVNADLLFDDPAPFVLAIGGRGVGKTYGVLRYIAQHNIPFIYLRRTQSQIDAVKQHELNPFNSINRDCGFDIRPYPLGKYIAGFRQGDEGDNIGIAIALSTFANIRGVDGTQYQVIVFDEAIPESHERAIKNEREAFLNALESINRNRELIGQPPIKIILLANSNTLSSPILDALGAITPLDRMIRRGLCQASYYNNTLSIYYYKDSPVSDRKKSTALYKISNSNTFVGMSIGNAFNASNYEGVGSRQLEQYTPLVSYCNITIYRHKSDGTYYIVEGVKAAERYTDTDNSRKTFRHRFWYLREALLDGRVVYATVIAKYVFEGVFA